MTDSTEEPMLVKAAYALAAKVASAGDGPYIMAVRTVKNQCYGTVFGDNGPMLPQGETVHVFTGSELRKIMNKPMEEGDGI